MYFSLSGYINILVSSLWIVNVLESGYLTLTTLSSRIKVLADKINEYIMISI